MDPRENYAVCEMRSKSVKGALLMMQKDLGPTQPQSLRLELDPREGTTEIVRRAKEGQDQRVTKSPR